MCWRWRTRIFSLTLQAQRRNDKLFHRKHFSLIPLSGNDFLAPVRIMGIFFSIIHTLALCNETISRTSRKTVVETRYNNRAAPERYDMVG
jgi:hypothetical protein